MAVKSLLRQWVAIFVWILGFNLAFAHNHKNINVELRAKWSGTPLVLEIGELLAKERGEYLWKFIDSWLQKEPELVSHNSGECIRELVSLGKSFVDGHLGSVLELSLSVRSTSPKLVLYLQLAQESLGSSSSSPHCCWVDVGSKLLFEESELLDWLDSASESSPDLFEFDHIYPRGGSSTRVAILYGALGTPCFKAFHNILSESSRKGLVKYVLRPVLLAGCEKSCSPCGKVGAGGRMNLAGYGVELALKNMEYKAIDDSEVKSGGESDELSNENLEQEVGGFIFSKLLERKPHLEAELMTFRDHLLSSEISDTMNVWEVKDLGYQAAQRIVSASEPLRLMQEINQNFPTLVSSLSRIKINESIKQEILSNQQMVQQGKNLLAINGALINADNLDLFTLIHMIHEELAFADKIAKMKVPASAVSKLLKLPEPVEQSVARLDFRSKEFVHYVNNLEEDPRYRTWRSNINELLMPLFPGQLHYIRKNLFHAVYVIDPASLKGLKLVETFMHYYRNNAPFRFGLILSSPEHIKSLEKNEGDKPDRSLSTLIIRLFLYVKNAQGVQPAFDFLTSILDSDAEDELVEESLVEEAFIDSQRTMQRTSAMELFSKLKNGEDYMEEALGSSGFVYKLGLSNMLPSLLMNGLVYGPSQAQFALIMAMKEELLKLQEGVYYGHINSRTDVLDKFLSDEGFKRYNPKIAGTGKDSKYVSLALPVIEANPVVKNLQYLHSSGTEDDVKPVTHWLVADLTQASGVRLLNHAIDYLVEGSEKARVGVLNNINGNLGSLEKSVDFLLPRIVAHVMQSSSRRSKHLHFLKNFVAGFNPKQSFEEALEFFVKSAEEAGLNSAQLKEELLKPSTLQEQVLQLEEERSFVNHLFSIKPGSNAVITNGRVFVQDDKPFIPEDFQMLEVMEYRRRIKDIQEIIEDVKWEGIEADDITSEFLSTVMMVVSSAMASRTRSPETAHFELLKADQSAIVRKNEASPLQIDAVINPLSSVAQKLTPLLLMLDEWLRPNIRIVLNPMNSLSDVPLKNFYRYVLPTKDDFLSDGLSPSGWFSNMPPSRTLTMNLDVPEPWLVEPVVAIHDLDNIVLEKLEKERTLHAVFELEALMVTGHCYENNEPPRGLQLILGTKQEPHVVDTIVMANLGYFQLKAAPGVWILRLADGRSSELYTLRGSKEGTSEGPLSRQIIVADLRGELVRLEVVKRVGKEDEQLLEPENQKKKTDKTKGFFEWAAGFMGQKRTSGSNDSISVRQGETINIFSVASGHLYERFLKIMMLSVLKNTKRPVKFWFIKNYLSPQFKDLIPHMAQEYDFEYELVTYKWPAWLHKQTEKQRIIWAYKILFLDVIFPLSLRKVIFVDADQIVRTDMGELYDMDIKGRPLAYTPFCDNNKEMDGYRFWSQGFWKEHLQGRPYHISALYVVDLDKFRQTAAGDNLRVFYESLSKDPNSLSNLDQDLPNYAQHTVPIFSLPQEWLWCESWCGNATKAKAKTIDLCNNPMTKEPKLQGAKRIVKEWPALDEEARVFTKRILGIEHGNAVQAPALAGESSPAPAEEIENLATPTTEAKDEL